ncbi:hypothetical protein CPB84DRAFT_1844318 [Gymnopilus junonius]|uniref:Uncharacterized protein n=1 Tax=Gymnopilus junonius TaxID=109634 RepID=A0A9P5NWP0_GYMJU|nr:hypothetical protein CPB84DRAFT_1844318 [Gymnopilus junonius]
MPKKSKAAQSHINNLRSNAQKSKQKRPSVTIEDVEDSREFLLESSSHPQGSTDQTKENTTEEGFIFYGEDGSLTLVGFLEDLGEDSLPDFVINQVDNTIDIFEGRTNGLATGLFIFDNAPSHQKYADDALLARKMPKNPSATWTHRKGGAHMHTTTLPNGETQSFYFDDDHSTIPGWFKGMEKIIQK